MKSNREVKCKGRKGCERGRKELLLVNTTPSEKKYKKKMTHKRMKRFDNHLLASI
jgi:hypothetical protein